MSIYAQHGIVVEQFEENISTVHIIKLTRSSHLVRRRAKLQGSVLNPIYGWLDQVQFGMQLDIC